MSELLVLASSALSVSPKIWLYTGFLAMVVTFLALDLGVFHRTPHVVRTREALAWTGIWVTTALLFSVVLYFMYQGHWFGIGRDVPQLDGTILATVEGREAVKQYLTGYVVEYSLSMDNVFVIALIFSYFGVPALYQHRVLFWGILGALVMRGIMIAVGGALIAKFHWTTYIFGIFLILTAAKMAFSSDGHKDLGANPVVRIVRRLYPIAPHYDGMHFFTQWQGRRAATPLLLALVVVEFTDLIFAVDSIPAIFAVTADPFIVLTSNVFAILGLRSLYFALAALIDKFQYLKPSLIAVLAFVGVKLLLVKTPYKIDTGVSLLVVVGILAAGIAVSIIMAWRRRDAGPTGEAGAPAPEPALDPAPSPEPPR
jgi:tellurite resistance protein TerC